MAKNDFAMQQQLSKNRMEVSFDTYDLAVRQLIDMFQENTLRISPEYQRHFVWDDVRQSQLVESLLLGIPVPSLFMATNIDFSWEVVDGLQRLTTLIRFVGEPEALDLLTNKGKYQVEYKPLKLAGLEKLTEFNGLTFADLPSTIQTMFKHRPIKVTVLNDKSDEGVRYDLFERLNTGGIILEPQEIRNCVYQGPFNELLKECSKNSNFRKVVKLGAKPKESFYEELVLRFFAYLEWQDKFEHDVKDFLNDYMKYQAHNKFDKDLYLEIFENTFYTLSSLLEEGIVRGNRKTITPVVLYEAISVGVAVHLKNSSIQINKFKLNSLLNDSELKAYTTGATNSRSKLIKRIEYVSTNLF